MQPVLIKSMTSRRYQRVCKGLFARGVTVFDVTLIYRG